MAKKRVLYISSEMTPFLKVSSVGELARVLPQAIQEKTMKIIFIESLYTQTKTMNSLATMMKVQFSFARER